MSNINQNTIIGYLEEVVPMMKNSDNPELCLMKFARDNNLTPAVAERLCHAFNSLKTNAILLDAGKDTVKRGSSFSLIDGDDFLKQYTDFTKDIDFSKNIKEASPSVYNNILSSWGLDQGEDSKEFKLASEKQDSYDLSSIYNSIEKEKLDKESIKFENALSKIAEENNYKKEAKEDYLITHLDAEKNAEMVDLFIEEELRKQASYVNNVVNYLKSGNQDLLNSFKKCEEDALFYKEDEVKTASTHINSFVRDLKTKSNYIVENIKRASSNGGKRLLRDSDLQNVITSNLINYIDSKEIVKAANEIKQNFKKESEDALLKFSNFKITMPDGETVDIDNLLKDNKNLEKDNKKFKKIIEKIEDESKDKTLQNISKALGSGVESMSNVVSDFGSGYKTVNDYLKNLKDTQKEKNLINTKIKAKKDLTKTISDSLFTKIVATDPVLSKLNDDELENVIEAYKTYRVQYPEIAFQPSLMKSLLRASSQIEGGEDVNTAKALLDTRKLISDAELKEYDLLEKGL